MINILHVLGGLGSGGAESLIMSVYRKIDITKIRFDFLTRGENDEELVMEIKELGGNVINIPKFPQKLLENYKRLSEFFKHNHRKYDVVHIHANSLLYIKPILEAKKYNMKVILHSHNTQSANPLYNMLHYINRGRINELCDYRIACSANAGRWMFLDKKYTFLKNAIDINKFQYNENVREKIRNELNITNKFVIGHVGRFVPQKNHQLLVEIYEAFQGKYSDTCLMMIGEGRLEEKIKKLVKRKKIDNSVYFLGKKDNVEQYMQAMDCFLFPSSFEGLGIVLIEAQASKLPIITSRIISTEALIDKDNIFIVDSDNNIEIWMRKLEECLSSQNIRKSNGNLLREKGYDIEEMSCALIEIYRKVMAG
ncbi:glycosyltransferase [Lachnospiraceae bacterium 29-84]